MLQELTQSPEWMETCRAFIDAVGDQMIVVGPDYTVLMANRAFVEARGTDPVPPVGTLCHELSHHRSEPCWMAGEACPLAAALETGESVTVIHEHFNAAGEKRIVSIVGSPVRDARGRVVGMLESIRDITREKALEAELRDRFLELEAARKKHQQFISVVCHEFKNILNSVSLNAQALPRDPKSRRHAERIQQESQRLARLVDDMRDADAIERQRFSVRRQVCELTRIVPEAVEVCRMASDEHEIRIELPPGPIRGDWDPGRLRQVMDNLLSNAVKYSPAGSEIAVDVRADDARATVSVADSGGGVPPDSLSDLFRPYARARYDVPGTGLGLFVSRGIIEAHGGELSVQNRQGEGATFSFWLPLV